MARFKLAIIFLVFTASFVGVLGKPTRRYRYDAEFLDSEIQRIRSGRAEQIEPIWTVTKGTIKTKPEVEDPETKKEDDGNTFTNKSGGNEGDSGEDSTSTSDDDYYGSSEEIDVTCAPDKGWHIRGN